MTYSWNTRMTTAIPVRKVARMFRVLSTPNVCDQGPRQRGGAKRSLAGKRSPCIEGLGRVVGASEWFS